MVKPELVSKKASTKNGISPENTKGSAPKKESKIQDKPVMTKPSLVYNFLLVGLTRAKSQPHKSKSSIVAKKESVVIGPSW